VENNRNPQQANPQQASPHRVNKVTDLEVALEQELQFQKWKPWEELNLQI
jgi:hypothetical protein